MPIKRTSAEADGEARSPEQPARRRSDRISMPPPPSRLERDRQAAAAQERSIPGAGTDRRTRGASTPPPIPPLRPPGRDGTLPLPSFAERAGASSPNPPPTTVPDPEAREDGRGPAAESREASEKGREPVGESKEPAAEAGEPAAASRAVREDRQEAKEEGREAAPDSDRISPPPTRLAVQTDRSAARHQPMSVVPVPEVPDGGLWASARYTVAFARARWQRRKAISKLRELIAEDTGRLDAVLGRLGAETRSLEIRIPVLSAENEAIDAAERRKRTADRECAELSNQQAEENARYAEIESERQNKVNLAEGAATRGQDELASLEAQRRALRDKRKQVDRKQKDLIKAADDRDREADKAATGEQAEALRASARGLRQEAAALDPERQDIERRLAALETPVSQAMAKVETLKDELASARRSLNDVREGHRVRLSELDAEQGRKTRELAAAEAEIQRRLITLGTLVNLNRIERPEFSPHYDDIDRLRGAIGARSNEIDRLTNERDAYDKPAIVRGSLVIGGSAVVVLTIILILAAAL